MTIDEYNTFCAALAHAHSVVQWGGAHVWKVAGKVFAICWDNGGDDLEVTFKCSDMSYDMLKEVPGCRPAPYLASRGMKWIQRYDDSRLDDDGLRDYLRASHAIVAAGLPKRVQRELGLLTDLTAGAAPAATKRSARRRVRRAT
jgi:predicted DNA-binding protein (MmcQ/YjbR family)